MSTPATPLTGVNATINSIDNVILKSLTPASQALVAIAQESKTTDSPLVKILTDVGTTTAVVASMPAGGGILGVVEGVSGLANILDQFILGAVTLFHPKAATPAPAAPVVNTVPASTVVDPLASQVAALTAQNQSLQAQITQLLNAINSGQQVAQGQTATQAQTAPVAHAKETFAEESAGDKAKTILTGGIFKANSPAPAPAAQPAGKN